MNQVEVMIKRLQNKGFALVAVFSMLIITIFYLALNDYIWDTFKQLSWKREEGQVLSAPSDRPDVLSEIDHRKSDDDHANGAPVSLGFGGENVNKLPRASQEEVPSLDGVEESWLNVAVDLEVTKEEEGVGSNAAVSDSLSEMDSVYKAIIEALLFRNEVALHGLLSAELRQLFSVADVRLALLQQSPVAELMVAGSPLLLADGLIQQRFEGRLAEGQAVWYEIVLRQEAEGWKIMGMLE